MDASAVNLILVDSYVAGTAKWLLIRLDLHFPQRVIPIGILIMTGIAEMIGIPIMTGIVTGKIFELFFGNFYAAKKLEKPLSKKRKF